ncbi:hypothetical protein NQ314_019853 [Rhamnusium bicolor]|uniref:Uncharacterized protein n=1 Tax=Rhamnusium bicolor TaxID=1586634 RepID=A0AAV8WN86_9CUCU|nr:hypothetical protein NQ314_019853 [Rhamnusium bicolor]
MVPLISARFQQKQMQEKEEKLLKLYENQQQRAFERVSRGSAGSNTSGSSTGGGKVRQMFDERRQKAGIDRSYPLEPLKSKTTRGGSIDRKSNITSRTVVKATVQKSVSSIKNGKSIASKREVVHSIYNNNDGDESYEEHKYEDANSDLFNSNSHRGIIEMMNSHNLNDTLDNEVMPKIGFDEVDDAYVTPKLSKVDAKPPGQNGLTKKIVELKPPLKSNGVTPILRKETNVSIEYSIRKQHSNSY